MATQRTPKTIRISEDTQRLIRLIAAFEEKTEGSIVEEAIPMYLQARVLAYGNEVDVVRELANSTPDTAGQIVDRLTEAMEMALQAGATAPGQSSGKDRLKRRATEREAVAAGGFS